MKRVLVILLLMSYSIASFGVSLNYFYCCGQLKTVSLSLKTENKDCAGKTKKGCCDNKIVTIKLKADQQKGNEQSTIDFTPSFSPGILYTTNYAVVNNASNGSINSLYKRPPPDNLPSRQILFCVFRI